MTSHPVFKPLILAVALALTGCGSAYQSPIVSGDDARVRVVPMTAETLLLANRSAFRPQEIPAVFSRTTGVGQPRGAGAVRTAANARPRLGQP